MNDWLRTYIDRQTYKHTSCNTAHPIQGRGIDKKLKQGFITFVFFNKTFKLITDKRQNKVIKDCWLRLYMT